LKQLGKYIAPGLIQSIRSICIKGLDENVFRNLKAEAVRRSMRISDAAYECLKSSTSVVFMVLDGSLVLLKIDRNWFYEKMSYL
jgi:hypothetical protein